MEGVRGSIPLAPTISDTNSNPPVLTASPRRAMTFALPKPRFKRRRMMSRLFLCLVFLGVASSAAFAQGAIKDKHGDWETRCETPPGAAYEQCAIVLSVVDADRPNLTLVVIVLNTADRKARLMRVIAPLGVLLPAGVSLRIDDEDIGRLNFLQCLANGCIAQVAMDDKLVDEAEDRQDHDARRLPDAGAGCRRSRARSPASRKPTNNCLEWPRRRKHPVLRIRKRRER